MAEAWDTERAADLARRAYKFVARTFPEASVVVLLDDTQDAVLAAQAAGDFPAYEEALREMCAVALREVKAARRGVA